MVAAVSRLPREITPGIHWISGCTAILEKGEVLHTSISAYLIVGTTRALIVDTGNPTNWSLVEDGLRQILGDRELDFILPTHPEVPHAGNLPRLLRKFPRAQIIGDVRDYHVYYPESERRLVPWPKGKPIDLGGGFEFTILDAPIKDLTSTVWGYESFRQVLFVADAFAYGHHAPGDDSDEPVHLPGECGLLSSELLRQPEVHQALSITRGALSWTKHVPTAPFFDAVLAVLETHPAKLIAPAHGNIIVDLHSLLPMMREAYSGDVIAPAEVLISREIGRTKASPPG